MAAAYAAHPERFTRAIPGATRAPRSRVDQPASHGGGLAGHRLSWMVNPSFLSTATAPLFPPSKSPEARRWPVANS